MSSAHRSATPLVPSRTRQIFFTLLGVYPLITALLYLVIPLTAGWQIWQVTLVVAPIMVTIMVLVLIPFIQRRLSRFILVPARH